MKTSASKGPKLPRKSKAQKERAAEILEILYQKYPNPHCELDHRNAFELLMATILSAQCTDVRVNMVTPALFESYPTPDLMAEAPLEELEDLNKLINLGDEELIKISESKDNQNLSKVIIKLREFKEKY